MTLILLVLAIAAVVIAPFFVWTYAVRWIVSHAPIVEEGVEIPGHDRHFGSARCLSQYRNFVGEHMGSCDRTMAWLDLPWYVETESWDYGWGRGPHRRVGTHRLRVMLHVTDGEPRFEKRMIPVSVTKLDMQGRELP